MPNPIPKLTLVQAPDDRRFASSHEDLCFRYEIVKAENTVEFAVGAIITKREVNARLRNHTLKVTLIAKK